MLRVGIAAVVRNTDDIHLSVIDQHIFHLYQVLQNTKMCDQIYIVPGADMEVTAECSWSKLGIPVISPTVVDGQLDVIIEVSAALDPRYLKRQQARGAKIVYGGISHPFFAGLAEPAIFNKKTFVPTRDRYDEVWVHSQYQDFVPMLRSLHRCPVHTVPLLWKSKFIAERAQALAKTGHIFEYKRGSITENLRIGILEHNQSLTRNFMVSLLAADAFERNPQHEGKIKHLFVLNTKVHINHRTLLATGLSLDLVKKSRASFDDAVDTPQFMAQFANTVISHQWYHGQNYTHLELLWGDYPLIHNSPFLWQQKEGITCGVYYRGFDVKAAAEALAAAVTMHDTDRARQRAQESYERLLKQVDPDNPAVVDVYADRLISLSLDKPIN